MKFTIKDVAKIAGVSKATVSRALGEYGYVKKETKRKVLNAAREIGYKPDVIARSMVTGHTRTIGLVVADIENPFFARLAHGINDTLTSEDYNLIVCGTNESIDEERKVIEGLTQKRIDGLIIAPTSSREGTHISEFFQNKLPVVLVDRVIEDVKFDAVCVKNTEGSYKAVWHLIQNGYKKIGFLSDSFAISSNAERLEGYKRALNDAGIELDMSLIREGIYTIESGYRESVSLLFNSNKPTAVFTANNFMTIGLLKAVKDMELIIPNDLAIISFDDMVWFDLISPTITAVAQPIYEIGQVAAQRLLIRIGGDKQSPQVIRLSTKLIIRESSCPPIV